MARITIRPAAQSDLDALVDLINREAIAVDGEPIETREELAHEWAGPGFSLEANTRVAVDGDLILGYAAYDNVDEPRVRPFGFLAVDPDSGYEGAELVDWVAASATRDLPLAPAGTRVTVVSWMSERNATVRAAWERAGFAEARRFYRMRIDFDGAPPPARVPDGYAIRAMRSGEEKAVFRALLDGFRDHYGFVEPTDFDADFELWRHHFLDGEHTDPELMLLSTGPDGSIAGICLCKPRRGPDTEVGWVSSLAVLPEHRRRGLAEAMLRHSFAVFHAMGKVRAGLGVDAESLTSATRLYEKCGMHVQRSSVQMQRVLREGEELANVG